MVSKTGFKCFLVILTAIFAVSMATSQDVDANLDNSVSSSETNITGFSAAYEKKDEIQGVIIASFKTEGELENVTLELEELDGDDVEEQFLEVESADDETVDYYALIELTQEDTFSEGNHSVTVKGINGNSVDSQDDIVDYVMIEGSGGHEEEGRGTVLDDFYVNTSTNQIYTRTVENALSYPVEAAFKGHALELNADSGVFSLLNSTGDVVKEEINASEGDTVDSSILEEGRYTLNNSEGNVSSIDVLEPKSDVTSRLFNFSNPEVNIYSYRRVEKIDTSHNFNYQDSITEWAGNDSLYELNTSKERYWIEVKGEEAYSAQLARTAREEYLESCGGYESDGETSDSSLEEEDENCLEGELEKPYIQDFSSASTFNVSGNAYDQNNGSAGSVELVLKGVSYRQGRINTEAPPFINTTTEDDGSFVFEGVPNGRYSIEVADSEWANAKGQSMFGSEDLEVRGQNVSGRNLYLNGSTGKFNISIDGPQEGFLYVYYLNKVDEPLRYSDLGVGTGQTNVTVEDGEYYVNVGRINLEERTQDRKPIGKMTVSEGDVTDVEVGFAETVYLNGTVNLTGTDETLNDGYVWIRSKGENTTNSYWTEIGDEGSDWDYTAKVAENRNYTVRLSPPYQSAFTEKEKEININETGDSLNFTLDSGNAINGTIETESGDPLEARVTVRNESEYVYRSAETDENGEYSVQGLKNGSYRVTVRPRNPRYEEESKIVDIDGETNTTNFKDFGTQSVNLNVSVQVSNGNPEGYEVEVFSESLRDQEWEREISEENVTGDTGKLRFKVPKDIYYKIEVEPDSSGEQEKREGRYVSGDTDVSFAYSQEVYLNGTVERADGTKVRAWVGARNWSENSEASQTTGEDGKFNLSVKDVPHEMRVFPHPSTGLSPKELSIDSENISEGVEVVYNLSDKTHLQGTINISTGNISEAFIIAENESQQSLAYQRLDSNNSYNLTGLENVSHRVYVGVRTESGQSKREEFTVKSPELLQNNQKNFTLGEQQTTTVEITTFRNGTGDREPNVTVQTSNKERRTNENGTVTFELTPGQTVDIYAEKDGFQSRIKEVDVSSISGGAQEVDIDLSLATEYSVTLNVSEIGNSGSEIDPPASVVFVSRENKSVEAGSVTVNTEGARPEIEGLTPGDYLVGLSTGPDTTYENTTASIQPGGGTTDTVNMTGSDGDVQYSVWYEVSN